jgi:hypothetical protein
MLVMMPVVSLGWQNKVCASTAYFPIAMGRRAGTDPEKPAILSRKPSITPTQKNSATGNSGPPS